MKVFNFIYLFTYLLAFSSVVNAQNTLHFDGVDDHINLGTVYNFTINESFSVEAWVKVGPSDNIGQIISNFNLSGKGWGFQIKRDNYPPNQAQENGVLTFYLSDNWFGGSSVFVNGITNLRDNQWHHVAVSYDGSAAFTGIRLYVDGILETTPSINFFLPNATITHNGATYIGALEASNSGTAEHFVGTMDELRIWSGVRLLSDFEAFKNAELSCLPDANLLGYYRFNQGTANGSNAGVANLIDDSGNNNNSTLSNFSLAGTSSNWTGRQPIGTQSTIFCDCYGLTYCYAKGLDDDFVYTNSVSTIKYDNINSGSSGGYGDYRGEIVEFVAGSNDVIKVTRATDNSNVGTGVWVDWNQNGTFEQNERILNLHGTNAVVGLIFKVPDDALSGYTRMRVVTELNNNNPNPCGNVSVGEVEDYCVAVRKTTVGGILDDLQSSLSDAPFPNPATPGYQVTVITKSFVMSALLVNTQTGQSYPLTVLSSQTNATGSINSALILPTAITGGLYNLVVLTQDGSLYSDNIRIQ